MSGASWVRIVGDGLVYQGPCLLHAILFVPDDTNDYVEVYDGRDATVGRLFMKVISTAVLYWPFNMGNGVRFDGGIWLNGIDGGVATTVIYTPLE